MNCDNGAYPCTNYGQLQNTGMTIRQRYAMAAMQGILSDSKNVDSFINTYGADKAKDTIAWTAFSFADAMIKFEEDEYEAKRQESKQTGEAVKEAERKEKVSGG